MTINTTEVSTDLETSISDARIETIDDQLDDVRGGHGDVPFQMGPDVLQPQRALATAGNVAYAAGMIGAGALLGPAQQLKWKIMGYPGK